MNAKTKVIPLTVTLITIGSLAGGAMAQTYFGINLTDTVVHPELIYDTDNSDPFGLVIDDGDLGSYTGQSQFNGITFDLSFSTNGQMDSRANIRNTGQQTLSDGSVIGPTALGNINVNEGGFNISFSSPVLFFVSGNASITEGESFNFSGPGFLEPRDGAWDPALTLGAASVSNPSGSGNGTLIDAHSYGFASGTNWSFEVTDDLLNDNRANYWFYVAQPVPEPSSFLILGLGGFGFILRRRR